MSGFLDRLCVKCFIQFELKTMQCCDLAVHSGQFHKLSNQLSFLMLWLRSAQQMTPVVEAIIQLDKCQS